MTNAVMPPAPPCPVAVGLYLRTMLRRFAPLSLCLTLVAAPAAAEVRALLVGVADYLVLDADLKGPAADVRLMAETLAARGVAPGAMLALTSDPAGLPAGVASGAPTKAEILAAMQALADQAQPGDTVVFYFSGHGSQAPDMSGDEGGGYDEILLPADAAGWKGQIGAVENALVDDELQAWARQLTGRGVRLVGLIDACHSATGFRALGAQGNPRGLPPEALSVPDDVTPAESGTPEPLLEGEFVFLYSSQSDQRSFEYPLADGSEWHGEFTLRLAEVLRSAPEASWAQVLAATSDAMVQGPARQLPDGEGTLLDAPVFGRGVAGRRVQVTDGALAGGLLQGMNEGDTVAFYASAAGGDPLGEATLAKVEARRATLTGPLPEGALWAEVVAPAAPPALRLGAPVRADAGDGHDYTEWTAALTDPAPQPDLVPVLVDGTVALAGADGVLDPAGPGSTPRIRPESGETPAEALARVMEEASHALRLRKLFAGMAGRSLTGKAPLEARYERRPGQPDGETCGKPGALEPVDPEQGLQPCDQLWVTVTNVSGKEVDVSALYFNADFTVAPLWPSRGLSNRLAPGESARVGMLITPDSTSALDELMLLAVPVDEFGARVDLTRLAEPQMSRAYADADSGAEIWLMGRMDPETEETTRGFSARPAAVMMLRQAVRLSPATE